MSKDFNPADWDWEMLQTGIAALKKEAAMCDASGDHQRREALRHAADFIEYHIDAGEILSPLQTYLTEK